MASHHTGKPTKVVITRFEEENQIPEPLGPQVIFALQEWVTLEMKEGTGPGIEGVFVSKTGEKIETSYDLGDFFEAINRGAPDAIARMLQAGAAAFIKDTADDHA